MKFSELWLRTLVNPALDSAALSHLLTMAGLEVEALDPVAADFSGVVVGQVLSVAPHPDADRLRVCLVDAGTGSPLQIVCGAPNVSEGARVPCALAGARLPGFEIKKAKLRGVESQGMLCSARELGLAEQADGLLLLPNDAPVGSNIRDYLHLDDRLYTLKLTPNRSDCLSVAGVAREVAALTGSPLNLPRIEPAAVTGRLTRMVQVTAGQACPRYCGRVISQLNRAAQTPGWMIERLSRSGLRSISPVVDITNYVLLELGQPLHAFDLDKLAGDIQVRMATPGETLTLLNDQRATLEADMLVIADDNGAQALAGIMGGAATAVDENTSEIFLEAAYFSPGAIAGRARRLGLSTDSSHRFERGVDYAATRDALERATALILEICAGAASAITEITGDLPQRAPVMLRTARASKVLGVALSDAQVEVLLGRLCFDFQRDGAAYQVTPPSYRFDLNIEEDLIEELARLHGYDNIVAQAPVARLTMLPQPEQQRGVDALRTLLTARDYQEVITYSFVDAAWEADFAPGAQPVVLKNPIASQMGVMRSTLLGGLMDVLRNNLNRRQERVRIFESGRCYLPAAEGFDQPQRLAGLAYGSAMPEQWGSAARNVDFFDVKADLEALCWPQPARFEKSAHPALHPGQCAEMWLNGVHAGWLGTLHPRLTQQYDLATAPVVFELALPALLTRKLPRHGEISRFQSVRRDLAVIVDESAPVQALIDAMYAARIEGVAEITLFDVYRGKGIDSDKKSLAFRVLLQDTQKTFTDTEVDTAMAYFTDLLKQQFNAQLRS
ncbi:phenylalanine--tRNA ligase beta subunit [Sulfuriferula plumbiphila]|uniref:Phenylalanine--tRNA ligase beta subunit n=1 Tax=Sulfuriferula plumbiphila TaxID=171865 RepID=A0A512L8Z1_9PROT|nr:phenylalanine--tRNA ligase subunit beta [Sulfuriferula plumbiphila]BBP04237.1 phenylalanine--tRNA ligase beta subunit [Sulfuriferula plumbiphila]GEP30933.1 phenylalanine--tRNA ligase beta subunit [Sulfuriferula plumbiphila]